MINSETPTGRLLRKAANLLNSVAEAAWTNDIQAPARWDLHRIGTEAHLAQRDILDMLGQPGALAEPLADFDILTALEQVAYTLAAIPHEFHDLDTERLEARVASLVRRVLGLTSGPIRTGQRPSFSGRVRVIQGARCFGCLIRKRDG